MTKVSCLLSLAAILAIIPASYGQTPAEDVATQTVLREEKSIVLRNTLASAKAIEERGDIAGAAKAYGDAYRTAEELGSSVEPEKAVARAGVVRTRTALAIGAAKKGDYREADLQIKQARKADPNDLKAIAFEKQNNKDLAVYVQNSPDVETIDKAKLALKDAKAAQILVRDGKLLMDTGKLDDGEAKLKEALALNPDNEAAKYYLNIIRERRQTRAAAIHEIHVKDDIIAIEEKWNTKESKLPNANPYARTNLIYTGRGRRRSSGNWKILSWTN